MIGNYGVPDTADRDEHGLLRFFESPNIQAVGVVVADVAEQYSHWTAKSSLADWCAREGVPAITGVDTRAIVTYLREQGSSLARITVGEEYDAGKWRISSRRRACSLTEPSQIRTKPLLILSKSILFAKYQQKLLSMSALAAIYTLL